MLRSLVGSEMCIRDRLKALRDGVELEEGVASAVRVEVVREEVLPPARPEYAQFTRVRSVVRLEVCVGWNRVVRRMLAAVGLPVMELHREAICGMAVELAAGEHMRLKESEVEWLWERVGGRELARERMKRFHS
eukprot:TRINITY_DN27816_c0_g1_i2.p2 TRINITY_DN27816_c0_g1~~TRINITY_DN27816_c0_g1_i2.p2  ORF type:complete len:134 (-),score=42.63 TRINITY_DN27816_c0_g1_i2:305-706(-)